MTSEAPMSGQTRTGGQTNTVGSGEPLLRFLPVQKGYGKLVFWMTVIILAMPIIMDFVVVNGTPRQQHDAFVSFNLGFLVVLGLLVASAHWTMPRAPGGRHPASRRRLWPKAAVGLTIGVAALLKVLPTTAVAAFFGAGTALFVFLLGVLVIDHHRWHRYETFR